MKRILICKRFTSVTHKQAKNYGAFARLITLASFFFPDPELGLCLQTRLLLGVPCAFVFEQSSSVFVALKVICIDYSHASEKNLEIGQLAEKVAYIFQHNSGAES